MSDLQVYKDALLAMRGGDPRALAEQYISERNFCEVDVPKFVMSLKNALLYERLDIAQQRLHRELIRQLGEYKNNDK